MSQRRRPELRTEAARPALTGRAATRIVVFEQSTVAVQALCWKTITRPIPGLTQNKLPQSDRQIPPTCSNSYRDQKKLQAYVVWGFLVSGNQS
jgi:hypothetical protein